MGTSGRSRHPSFLLIIFFWRTNRLLVARVVFLVLLKSTVTEEIIFIFSVPLNGIIFAAELSATETVDLANRWWDCPLLDENSVILVCYVSQMFIVCFPISN